MTAARPARPPAGAGTRPAVPRRTVAAEREAGAADPAALLAPTVTLCRDPELFASLGPQWDELHRRSPAATPFQTHAWLHSWWLSYGTPGRLRLVLVRRDGRLVGAAPLMLAYRPLPALVPLGGPVTDFCDVLLDEECADAAAEALAAGLRRAARTAVVDLREVRPGAAAERLLDHWRGPHRRLGDSVCMELPGLPMEGLTARLPASAARRTRGKLRKLDSLGVESRPVPAAEAPAAVALLLRLHALQWQDRGATPEHLTARFAAHLTRAVTSMAATGHARLTEFRVDGEVLAVDLTLLSAGLSGGYLYGAHPKLRARGADLTVMLLRAMSAHAAESGREVLSMLRGNEPYKQHWRPLTVTHQRLLLARRRTAPALGLLAARAAARSRLVGLVRARAPHLLDPRRRPALRARRRTGGPPAG